MAECDVINRHYDARDASDQEYYRQNPSSYYFWISMSCKKRVAKPSHSLYVMICAIWYIQFKKREIHPWRTDTFSNVAGL